MATGIKFDKGWKRMMKALDPLKFKGALRKELRRAAVINGKVVEAKIRSIIQSGAFDANADLTIAIKGSSKPLVDTSTGLFQAITSLVLSDTVTFIGVLRTSEVFDIARLLHDGGSMGVTPRMRSMFDALWKASKGSLDPSKLTGRAEELFARKSDGWKPLRATTAALVIPSRPFIQKAFDSGPMKAMIRANWSNAVSKTLKGRAKG